MDPTNFIEKATPLHLALRIEDPSTKEFVVESLLDAGADTTSSSFPYYHLTSSADSRFLQRIKNKFGNSVSDIVATAESSKIRMLFRKALMDKSMSKDDVASGKNFPPLLENRISH